MSDSAFGMGTGSPSSGTVINHFQQTSTAAKPSSAKPGTSTADAQVTLSTTAQIQAMSRIGAGVGQLAAMFQMPVSSVQDDLGIFPISTRTTIKSAPIADPNNEQQTELALEEPETPDYKDAHVQLSTTSQVQSMSQTGANLQQIAATLGLTVAQVSEELGTSYTDSRAAYLR